MSARTRQDWILWLQLGCALVATAHAEYALALASGLDRYVALAVPGALDLYVIRALQKHKDVLPAVLVMVAANVASILVAQGVLAVTPGVLAAVGALAPLLVWRGHVLRVHASTGAVSAPVDVPDEYAEECTHSWRVRLYPWHECDVPETAPADVLVQVSEQGAVSAPVPGTALVTPDGTPVTWDVPEGCTHYGFCRDANGEQNIPCPEGAPDHVPAEWSTPDPDSPVPYLAVVPDLPPDGYAPVEPGSSYSPVLQDSDWTYLPGAAEYVHSCKDLKRTPTVRGLKLTINVGQDRARRLLEHLEGETK